MKNLEIENKEVSIEMSIGWKGYGQYRISVDGTIDGEKFKTSFHCTSSELYDKRNDDDVSYDEYQDMLFNNVEYELTNEIKEFIYELNDRKEDE